MNYPIFNSFINQIENEFAAKKIALKKFKTWHEDQINATGLEIAIDLTDQDNFIKEVDINFDWDRFRETVMAQKLEGLQEHPMLQNSNLKSITVSPKIDIEVSWKFDECNSSISLPLQADGASMDSTSNWMSEISASVNELLSDDDIITRWHFEVEGNHTNRYLSSACLISYFQYDLSQLKSLNQAHLFIHKQLEDLFIKSRKVRKISDMTLQNVA